MIKVAAIVPSAGVGKRLNPKIEKPFIKLIDKPILAHTLIKLSNNAHISEIVLAVARDKIAKIEREIINKYKIKKVKIVAGGVSRQDSVRNALKAVSKNIDYILIHDGVRPFITDKLINDSIRLAYSFGAGIIAVPVKPTLKFVTKDRFIKYTPDRRGFWEAQTPQVFKRDLIEKAYLAAKKKNISSTDDSMLVERIGVKPKIMLGSYSNIKITTPEDLELARIIIKKYM